MSQLQGGHAKEKKSLDPDSRAYISGIWFGKIGGYFITDSTIYKWNAATQPVAVQYNWKHEFQLHSPCMTRIGGQKSEGCWGQVETQKHQK